MDYDIIKLLLNRDLTRLCYQIFTYLDIQSLVNCRLVCYDWYNFIDYQFFELSKGKKWIKKKFRQKLTLNILNDNYIPKTIKVTEKERLFAVVADEDSVWYVSFIT